MDPIEHKKSLMKLKQTDPEFYTYLKENDKNLLEFNVSDDDDRSSISESDTRHIPSAQLEVGKWNNREEKRKNKTVFLIEMFECYAGC